MTAISIELVPRSAESVAGDLRLIASRFPVVDAVNVPDLLRFELRSWDACALARGPVGRAIPHVRAMDFDAKGAERLLRLLAERELDEVLVVQGNPPQDLRTVHATTSAELIRWLRQAAPRLRIYAAFDPYRRGLRAELDLVRAKLEAGANGLFTQPFFDLRLLEICAEQLAALDVYWGVSPVTTRSSRRYWEVTNAVVFPDAFAPTLAWNRSFAAQALAWARARETNLYFMPIRVGLAEYLEGIL